MQTRVVFVSKLYTCGTQLQVSLIHSLLFRTICTASFVLILSCRVETQVHTYLKLQVFFKYVWPFFTARNEIIKGTQMQI